MSVKYQINEQYTAMQEVQDFVTHLPALFEAKGKQLFANGRNVLKGFEVVKGHPVLGKVVVKRFHARNIFQTIAYSTFTTSKAQRAFYNGLKLLECGLSTPEPIAYVEERNGGILRQTARDGKDRKACRYRSVYERTRVELRQIGRIDRLLLLRF